MSNLLSDLQNQKQRLQHLLQHGLPGKIIQSLEGLVYESFAKEQYQDGRSSKWAGRKKADKVTSRRNLLVKTGKLIQSVEVEQISLDTIRLSAGYPVGSWNLAQIHNEGLKPVPTRQFMPKPGDPLPIEAEIEAFLDAEFDKIFT